MHGHPRVDHRTASVKPRMMKLKHSRLLRHVRLLLRLWAIGMLAAAAAGQRPSCRTNCGGVDIQFPFGIDKQCALHSGFELSCKHVDGSEKPFSGDFEVTKISVPDGKAWIKTWISKQCYIPGYGMNYSDAYADFTGTPFWLSKVDNKIVVIGCNTLAYMMGSSYVIGCRSTCDNDVIFGNGSSFGVGYCQADVPKNIQYYYGYFNKNYNTTEKWQRNPCGYMALMEEKDFEFNPKYLESTVFDDTHKGKVPTVLNWRVGSSTCDIAKKNMSSYLCVSSNSECLDTKERAGYRCNCSHGYSGNPYITDGCQDIDECLDNVTYPCHGICANTPGNYSCSCHPGNSMMNGVCTPTQNEKSAASVALPVVGASVGLVVLVITIACGCLIQERRKLQNMKQNYFRQHGGLILFEEMKSKQGHAFKIFTEEELQQATNKFSEQEILGHGGHGTVYKGLLKGDAEVAVKRCMTIDEQHKKEFGKEMLILSQINHVNIVKLLGCCLEVEVPMLVYEYVPNGTLFHLIHGNHGRHVSLATRLRIAHESADALAYLHSYASPPILHGDVKSSNILLDEDHKAKVSDFGASILAPTDESQFVTLVQGTCGYLDPEYMQTCRLTDKSDVYSFGVVLLELLTGKKAFNLEGSETEKSLSMRFLSAMKENRLEGTLDDQIKSEENMEFLEEIAELAKQCMEMCGENRPSMKEVAEKLGRLRMVMQHPWAQQSSEEMESLLGESSSMACSIVISTENFSIEKKAVAGLESGR